jgi:hypothetical protein
MLEAFDDAFSKYATKHHSMACLLRKTIVRQHESAAFARIRYHKENRRVTVTLAMHHVSRCNREMNEVH